MFSAPYLATTASSEYFSILVILRLAADENECPFANFWLAWVRQPFHSLLLSRRFQFFSDDGMMNAAFGDVDISFLEDV